MQNKDSYINTNCKDQADELVEMADVNGDGSIDYSEFVQLYNFKSAMIN